MPVTMVIFGVTGDLGQRKLLPALFDLYEKGFLPKDFALIGFSRRVLSDEDFRAFITQVLTQEKHAHKKEAIEAFVGHACYQQGTFEDAGAYENLSAAITRIDASFGTCANKLFHLAVPPVYYETILTRLAHSGLTKSCSPKEGWTRVLVEKPFGSDQATAQNLDELLGKLFDEEQIFRIDHYLAKEALQDILSFRFSNALFEPIWNNKYIEKVCIKLHETQGVEGRGAFYDEVGALRDVGQNHVLQMLALVAMENPGKLEAGQIRVERAKIFRSLRVFDGRIMKGQYRGYKEEQKVSPSSKTETYFLVTATVKNRRWRGVPFFLESGKKLKETKTEIAVYFKTSPCLCPIGPHEAHQNIVTFRIQPDEGISVQFWAKQPGFAFHLEPKVLSFHYKDSFSQHTFPDPYERVLFDCIRGDQTLFTSTEEIRASWAFISPIIEAWQAAPLHEYDPGTDGPISSTNF